jgi:futalosine hydrolase
MGSRRDDPPPTFWVLEPLGPWFDLVVSGVGKAQAAGAAAWAFDPARHAGVLSVGVGGALPGSTLTPKSVVLGRASLFADEGSAMPGAFRTIDAMGFPAGGFGPGGAAPPPGWLEALAPLADAVGPIATVSTCSGTDELAMEVVRRTGAVAEAMEGAAVAAAISRIAADPRPAFGEIRVISNSTGDRERQVWDLAGALDRLGDLARALAAVGGRLAQR